MIGWISYPKSKCPPLSAQKIVTVFERVSVNIDSNSKDLSSNAVLEFLSNGLREIDFEVEKGKKKEDRIDIPVQIATPNVAEEFLEDIKTTE